MLRAIRRVLRMPHKLAMLQLALGMRKQSWLNTAHALSECGVLRELDSPRSEDDLARALGIVHRDAFRSLLAEGVRHKLLRRGSDGRLSRRGRFARCLTDERGRPVDAMMTEIVTYHQEVARNLPALLRGEAPQDYLARYGALVAVSSRIAEPMILDFMQGVLGTGSHRILEIGCGAGAYLVDYAKWNPETRGVGLDLSADVASLAEATLARAGLADRFRVAQGDARRADALPEGPFDVITAHQNLYYFDEGERRDLWTRCRSLLAPEGRVAIVTTAQGGPMSDYFDLILRSTSGCTSLPTMDQACAELEAAGFTDVRRERLMPGDEFWGIVATATSSPA